MDPATWRHDRAALLDELTLWIVGLNLDGVACNRRLREAAQFAALGSLRSGSSVTEALRAGRTVIERHVGLSCN